MVWTYDEQKQMYWLETELPGRKRARTQRSFVDVVKDMDVVGMKVEKRRYEVRCDEGR